MSSNRMELAGNMERSRKAPGAPLKRRPCRTREIMLTSDAKCAVFQRAVGKAPRMMLPGKSGSFGNRTKATFRHVREGLDPLDARLIQEAVPQKISAGEIVVHGAGMEAELHSGTGHTAPDVT